MTCKLSSAIDHHGYLLLRYTRCAEVTPTTPTHARPHYFVELAPRDH